MRTTMNHKKMAQGSLSLSQLHAAGLVHLCSNIWMQLRPKLPDFKQVNQHWIHRNANWKTYDLYANDDFIISYESSLSTNVRTITPSLPQLELYVVKYIHKYVRHKKRTFDYLLRLCCLV